MYVISFLNKKGGVGKTTLAVHTAYALAESFDARVLLIDNDDQGNSSQFFDVAGEINFADVLDGSCGIEKAIKHTRVEGIDIIPSDIRLAEANIEMIKADKQNSMILKTALAPIGSKYDICIIDNPPRIDSMTVVNSILASDELIIVCTPDLFAISGVAQMKDIIDEAKEYNPNIRVRCLINMYSNTDGDMTFKIGGLIPNFNTKIRKSKNPRIPVDTAMMNHLTMFEAAPQSAFSQDMMKFVEEMTQGEE